MNVKATIRVMMKKYDDRADDADQRGNDRLGRYYDHKVRALKELYKRINQKTDVKTAVETINKMLKGLEKELQNNLFGSLYHIREERIAAYRHAFEDVLEKLDAQG